MTNPWKTMTCEEGRAMDKRKDPKLSVMVKRAVFWNIIKRFLPRDLSQAVLDLGGGTGVWAIPIAKAGHRVILADISPGLLACAEEKIKAEGLGHLVTLKEMDMGDLSSFADSSFPLVLALGDPLSYCAAAGPALTEIRRVTAKGGILIGDVENRYESAKSPRRVSTWMEAKMALLEGKACWPEEKDDPCIRLFTPPEIRRLLEAAGWSVLEMYPSDLVAAFLTDAMFAEVCSQPSGMEEVVSMEEELRKDGSILGAGMEIQFVVRN